MRRPTAVFLAAGIAAGLFARPVVLAGPPVSASLTETAQTQDPVPPPAGPGPLEAQFDGVVDEGAVVTYDGLLAPAEQVEAFFDGLMAALLEAHDVAGATVAVVEDGRALLAKGYGFDDVDARRPVDPDLTLFRIGSISKTFTWTAVMQLVEQGRLDLRADVNRYLTDFQIPEGFSQPITLENLLTHTPGFEDQVLGLFARDASALTPLAEILERELPKRVRPPGTVASYSNHGTGIAGYIVEEVSGLPWDEYVERNILRPLAMLHTTFRQPVPNNLGARMSLGYRHAGDFIEEPFEYVPLAPVGSASSTANDMARYMIAHLQLGELDGVRILQPQTALRMQSELFRHAAATNPSAHGFYSMSRNGERVIGHGGDTLWFHSEMALLPARGIGLFVSTNSAGGAATTGAVFRAFMEEFFPVADAPAIAPPEGFAERAERYLGTYRANRYSHTTLAKLAAVGAVTVTLTPEGELQTSATGSTRWIETEPLTFRERHGERTLVFRADEDGDITHLFLGWVPVVAFDRLGFWDRPTLHASIAAAAVLLQLGVLLLWPLAAFVRGRHRYLVPARQQMPLGARLVAWLSALAVVGFGVLMIAALADPNEIVFGIPLALKAALTLALLGVPTALATLVYAFNSWRLGTGSLIVRTVYSLCAISLLGTYWLLWYWNLLGYRY